MYRAKAKRLMYVLPYIENTTWKYIIENVLEQEAAACSLPSCLIHSDVAYKQTAVQ